VKRNSYLSSEKFSMGDFTWFFGLYPDGDTPDSRGFLSIYLFVDLNNLPKNKHISVDFEILIVNPTNSNNTFRKGKIVFGQC
jgi:hypothetical protein